MNYYERHIGDYLKDTAHLSLLEHGVYARLLDVYYTREGGIPQADCGRLVGARSKDEREAMQTVLGEFFKLVDGMYIQPRADREIAKYQEGEPEREVKKANEDNRLRRHREERAALFRKLTAAGQHASWNVGMAELRDTVKRLTATAAETPQQPLPATAPATPATATQSHTHTQRERERDSEADASAKPLTAKERVWALGVPLLGEGARGLLGKLAKAHGDEAVAGVLAEATIEKPIEPKAWVIAACEAAGKSRSNGHDTQSLLDRNPRPEWVVKAGFDNIFEAETAGCGPGNWQKFHDGRRATA